MHDLRVLRPGAPETFQFAHHGANGVYIVTKPDGTAERFRDKPGSPRQIRLIGRIGGIGPIRRGDPAPACAFRPGPSQHVELQVDRGNEERGAGLRTAAGQLRRYQHSWSRIGSDSRVKTCEEIWAGQKERESIGGCQGRPASGHVERLPAGYWKACELARDGRYEEASGLYVRLLHTYRSPGSRLRTLIQNDLAVIDAMEGKLEEASKVWQAILTGDRSCLPARLNFRLVEAELAWTRAAMTPVTTEGGFVPAESEVTGLPIVQGTPDARAEDPALNNGESLRVFSGARRVAVISLLFNWPSTGGGNMHTAGLVEFLGRDGYDVRHFYGGIRAGGSGGSQTTGWSRATALSLRTASGMCQRSASAFALRSTRFGRITWLSPIPGI